MPFASMSNVTSICGTPRGAGGRPVSVNVPSCLLRYAISLSPCSTLISTDGWLSSAVVKTCERFTGMVLLRSMIFSMIWPRVSMPSDSGVTSSRRMSLTSPFSTPAWIDAPAATASSGLTPLCGSLPVSSVHELGDRGHTRRAADEDHVVDLRLVEARVADRLLERAAARLEQVASSSPGTAPG